MKTMAWIVLVVQVLCGFCGSGHLAIRHWSAKEACPLLGLIPACYVAFAAYSAVTAGVCLSFVKPSAVSSGSVLIGVAFAAGLALTGSAFELSQGGICPKISGIPMCYISLAMSAVMFFWGDKKTVLVDPFPKRRPKTDGL